MKYLLNTVFTQRFCVMSECILLAAIALAGCARPTASSSNSATNSEIQAAWQFTPQPPQVGASQWTIALKDETGKPLSGAKITIEGNMSHPGMQPVLASLHEAAPGQYQAPLNFTMSGDWFVLIDATLKDGRTLHKQCDVPNVREK